jgi:RNA 2',3'-cyclic 3'-phosphodiesterase
MPRLFTGIEIPPDIVRTLSGLRGGLPGARWIDPENYHLTLRFIGDIDNPIAEEIAEALAEVAREPFSLRFVGLGAFGGRKPHIVHAAVEPSPALSALQAEHERLIQRAGIPPEGRKFTPHVTIARLRGVSPSAVAQYIESRGGFATDPFEVTRFALFSARANQGGGPYIVEETYPLDGRRQLESRGDMTWQTG